MKILNAFVALFLFLSQISVVFSMDIVRWNHDPNPADNRRQYKFELITQALEKTIPLYGPYKLVEANQGLIAQRAIEQVKDGESINIFMAVTSPEWEESTLPIRIPIRRGILNYRLLMINSSTESAFSKVERATEFSNYIAGLRRGWATVALFEKKNLPMIQLPTLEGLYRTLQHKRIDYIPRGINEVFDELALHQTKNPNLMVSPSLAIYTQAPYYIFVSPKEERLAKRLEAGLEMMIADKSLKRLFDKYYADKIAKANLKSRKVIRIDNPTISEKTPLARKELWFEYDL